MTYRLRGHEFNTTLESFVLRHLALRQLGEMLEATPKAKGSKGQLISRGVIGGSHKEPPIATLRDLGLTKKTSMYEHESAQS